MPPRSALAISLSLLAASALPAAEKVTYNDQILPLFKNACLNCHNPDKKKAGLDLSTYQATLAGSDNGKVLESGNAGSSLLLKCVKQTEDPKMPPKGDKLSDSEIAMIESWIQGQLLETVNGKAVVASNNVQIAVVSLSKPDGPPPMPVGDLPMEPIVRTKTANSLVALAASPWAPLVAVGGQKQVVLYHTDTLKTLGILPFPEGFPAILRFSRNGQLLMTGGGLGGKSGKVVLWKVATGERAGEVGNEFDQVLGADLSPDQAFVALGGPTKVLKIYATKDGHLERSVKKHTDWITAVAFSPDGKFLASADRAGGVVVWEGTSGKEYVTLPGHKQMVTSLAFMPGVLASASEDGKITLWDIKEGKEIRSWNAHANGVESVEFTPDGRLVSSGRDKFAKVWDQNGKALLTSEAFRDIALRAVLANERVVAGDWTGQIRVIKFPENKAVGEITSNPPTIQENLSAAEARQTAAKANLATLQQALAAADAELKKATAPVAPVTPVEGTPPPAPAPTPSTAPLEQALAKAQEAVKAAEAEVAATTAEAARWQRAQAYMGVHRSRQSLTDMAAQLAGLTAAAKDALVPIEKLQNDIAAGDKAAADAATAAKAKAEAQAAAVTAATEAKKAVADGEGKLRAAIARKVTNQATLEKATAGAATAVSACEKKAAEIAALDKAANELPAGSPERGAADAKAGGPRAELTKLENGRDAAQAAATAAKTAADASLAEVETLEKGLVKPREIAAAAEIKVRETVQAAKDAQAAAKAATAKVADLRQKQPGVTADAKAAKAKAEKDGAALAKQIEAAKAQAERLRAEYETRYRPAPLASS